MNNSINGQTSILNADLTNDELDDAQLEAIYGGMNCDVARGFAKTFRIVSNILDVQGDYTYGSIFAGLADGYEQGCG